MPPPHTSRHAIVQWMMGIAVLASLLTVPRLVGLPDVADKVGILGGIFALVLLCHWVEWSLREACPACSCQTLRPIVRHPGYFLCSACGARFKRFGLGPWLDASGPDDAARYRRAKVYGIWKGYAPPENLDGSNSGHLLRTKRSRDLLVEVKRSPPQAHSERALEDAKRKVRKFLNRLKTLDDLEF